MVTRRSFSDCSNSTSSDPNEDDQDLDDTVSVATSDDGSDNGQVVLADDIHKEKPTFGNVSVANSSDIHFGNKTYYQGPVTIKQFLYANPQLTNGEVSEGVDKLAITNVTSDSLVLDSVPDCLANDNPSFVPDAVGIKIKNNVEDKIIHSGLQQPPPVRKSTRWLQNFSRQHVFLIISLTAVLLVSLVTLMTVLLTRHQPVTNTKPMGQIYVSDSNEQDKNTPVEYPIDPDVNVTLPEGKLWIVSRKEWLAEPPSGDITPLNVPVPYVIISHTATENCTDFAACTFQVRIIQSFHRDSRKWSDIGYNFLVGGDGNAYVGRGWKSVGAHTYGYNAKSIGIAFIGTFNQYLPPKRQIDAAKQVIELGVELGYLVKDYKIVAARQLQTTQSPGHLLYQDIKTWSHWSKTL